MSAATSPAREPGRKHSRILITPHVGAGCAVTGAGVGEYVGVTRSTGLLAAVSWGAFTAAVHATMVVLSVAALPAAADLRRAPHPPLEAGDLRPLTRRFIR